MSTVTILSASFNESGTNITGDVTFEVTFTETEKKLDMGFSVAVVVQASDESTTDVVVHVEARSGRTKYLSSERREVRCESAEVFTPGGKSSLRVTRQISTNHDDLFNSYRSKWAQQSDRGINIVRVEIWPDFGASNSQRLNNQRL